MKWKYKYNWKYIFFFIVLLTLAHLIGSVTANTNDPMTEYEKLHLQLLREQNMILTKIADRGIAIRP